MGGSSIKHETFPGYRFTSCGDGEPANQDPTRGRIGSQHDEPETHGLGHRIGPARRIELRGDRGDMEFSRVNGNAETAGDQLVRGAFREMPQHLPFACCQKVVVTRVGLFTRRTASSGPGWCRTGEFPGYD